MCSEYIYSNKYLLVNRYSLYLAVMNSIDGYFETPWGDIDIEQIVTQLAEFDVRYYVEFITCDYGKNIMYQIIF